MLEPDDLHKLDAQTLIKIGRLRAQHKTVRQIAKKLELPPTLIDLAVTKIHRLWIKEIGKEYSDLIAGEMQKLDAIEAAAWHGWHRSLQDEVSVETTTAAGEDGPVVEQKKKVKGQSGNPNFLRILDDCIEKRAKLLSLYKKPEDEESSKLPKIVEVLVTSYEERVEFDKTMGFEDFKKLTDSTSIDEIIADAQNQAGNGQDSTAGDL